MEKLNMWGRPGCELPEGGRCQCCCALAIINGAVCGSKKIDHELYKPCPVLKIGFGCSDYDHRPTSPCRDFDCRRATPAQLVTLFGIARIVFGINQRTISQAQPSTYWRGLP